MRNVVAPFVDIARDGFAGAFADFAAVNIHTGHTRLRGKRMKDGVVRREVAPAKVVTFFGQYDDGAAFRRFISKRRKLSGIRQMSFFDSGRRKEVRSGAIAQRDCSGFVEEKYVHVAGG